MSRLLETLPMDRAPKPKQQSCAVLSEQEPALQQCLTR